MAARKRKDQINLLLQKGLAATTGGRVLALLAGFFADDLYTLFAPGYSQIERTQVIQVTRVLLLAQVFFVVSYVLTGALESLRRFLVPALAPLFYNIGIILGTVLLSKRFGLLGPAYGVLLGSSCHFLVQLPLAVKLGFRFTNKIRISKGVKNIGKLALPRVIEVSFLQISKMVELFLASIISTASYAYFYLGNSLQLLPVGLFGTSIAKAALPTLSSQAEDVERFKRTLYSALHQMVFLILPLAVILMVLRIPLVRIIYGRRLFDWDSTVQTGMVVSAFGVGIVFQAASALLARSFYALHDTKTPVLISIVSMLFVVTGDFILVKGFSLPVWALAASFSAGSVFQAASLYVLINKKLGVFSFTRIVPLVKSATAAFGSGVVMYLLLKIFDRSVWVKRLSFLKVFRSLENIPFEKFVLDTRYTANLLVLTVSVSIIGVIVYLGLSIILGSQEVWTFFNLVKKIFIRRKVAPIPAKEQEPVAPTPTESGTV